MDGERALTEYVKDGWEYMIAFADIQGNDASHRILIPPGSLGGYIEWQPIALICDYTGAAVAANRTLYATIITDAGVVLWVGPIGGNIATGQVGGYDIYWNGAAPDVVTARLSLAGIALTGAYIKTSAPPFVVYNTTAIGSTTYLVVTDSAAADDNDTASYRFFYRRRARLQ